MRKLNVVLFLALLVGAVSIIGCQDDPIVGKPTIDFKGGAGYTYGDVTLKSYEKLLVGFNAAYDDQTDNLLTKFILKVGNDVLVDSILNTKTFSADYQISFDFIGETTLVAIIADAGGFTDQVSFKITIEEGGVKVRKTEEFVLGSVNDLGAGSFYSAVENVIYYAHNVVGNAYKVDFIFFKGPVNQNTLAAPDDDDVKTVYPSINDWTVHNKTRFFLTEMTAQEFDALEDYHIFPEFTGTTSKANHLKNGDVVYFKTDSGKQGYVKVIDLFARGDVAKLQVIIEE
ncbi:MAG: hypothetical protein WBJ84_03405 [Bacteroidales bacterium]